MNHLLHLHKGLPEAVRAAWLGVSLHRSPVCDSSLMLLLQPLTYHESL